MNSWSLLTKGLGGLLIIGASGGGTGIRLGSLFKKEDLENKRLEAQEITNGNGQSGISSTPEQKENRREFPRNSQKSTYNTSREEDQQRRELISERKSDGTTEVKGSPLGDYECKPVDLEDGSRRLVCQPKSK
ncbi:hypothetical protein MSUIS_07130 [Mycoplasma suis KI3806]|uniref:Uncharacterized protein n=1 Tax=Mycoplasma suis (strain KI_3806) TaxID=708248 RepID=F0V2C5_MYCS3|nr:hypothetical protein [Mycoplasma suis]CBZ40806.1 hypothetical protein MSUIS_07130 [Mycoplasma suis KI3806]